MPTGLLVADGDPAEVAVARETIKLAFVAALQHLPPRQRAVLVLCEVLRWQATEVAELLETSVASVNSALQRARATLAQTDAAAEPTPADLGAEEQELLARYVKAFEAYDMEALTSLIAGGREAVDAAVRSLAPRPRRHPHLVVRPRHRLQRLARRADGQRERLAGVRPVQADRRTAATSRGRCRCSRSRTAASSSSRSSSTPRRCSRSSGCRCSSTPSALLPSRAQSVRTSWRPISATSSRSAGEALRSRTGSRAGRRRAEAARARRPSPRPARRRSRRTERRRRRSRAGAPQTRSVRPGRSSRAIGPQIAKAIVCGAEAVIIGMTVRTARNSSFLDR